jgi:hypothetical protein
LIAWDKVSKEDVSDRLEEREVSMKITSSGDIGLSLHSIRDLLSRVNRVGVLKLFSFQDRKESNEVLASL